MLLLNKHMSVLINQNVPAGPRDGGGGLRESSQSFASTSKHKERKKEKNSRLNSRFPSVATRRKIYFVSAEKCANGFNIKAVEGVNEATRRGEEERRGSSLAAL